VTFIINQGKKNALDKAINGIVYKQEDKKTLSREVKKKAA
jgi:hypothetical protein